MICHWCYDMHVTRTVLPVHTVVIELRGVVVVSRAHNTRRYNSCCVFVIDTHFHFAFVQRPTTNDALVRAIGLMNTRLTSISVALAVGAIAIGFPLEIPSLIIYCLAVGACMVCIFAIAKKQLKRFFWLVKKKRNSNIPAIVDKARYVAIDCEMVGVGPNGKKSALARVSLVDWDLQVIFDTYVQVMDRVTDYRTHVSGIRRKHLKGPNAMNCRKCRETVAELLQDKVLVGHGLENDFDVLHLIHPDEKIRDTSLYQPLQRLDNGKWKPRKLRELVHQYLGVDDFQQGEHDSIHDARAVMQLYHLFYQEWERNIGNGTDD